MQIDNDTDFIAYVGTYYTFEQIRSAFKDQIDDYHWVKSEKVDNAIFARIVYSPEEPIPNPFYNEKQEPYKNNYGDMVVSNYNESEFMNCRVEDGYSITNEYKYLIDKYQHLDTDIFKELSNKLHFCAVIYDKLSSSLIAGITTPSNENNHLYVGKTCLNELVYSNNKKLLKRFCLEKTIKELPNETFMKNGILYDLDGNEISFSQNYISPTSNKKGSGNTMTQQTKTPLIPKTQENANNLIDGLNSLLLQITVESVREQLEKNIEDYLASDDPKKQIEDYLTNELDNQTKKEVLQLIKKYIQEFGIKNNVEETIKNTFDSVLEEYKKTINLPISHVIKLDDIVIGKTKGGFYHEKFEQILRQTRLDEPIMLIGPAGSGKNVAVSQVADALGLHMYYTNNASNEFKLTGFIDAGGNYRETEFYKAFKKGGVFFLDEIDASDPTALIVINAALANGYMAFPHETIDRHKDFRIITAANTWGKGSDLQYVGRNTLDAATLDRFDNIFFDYDRKLEQCLYPNEEVLKFMWAFRDAVLKTKIPHIVSTRCIGKVYKKDINNIPVKDILTSNIIKNLSQDDVNTIIGNMSGISNSNKYYKEIKTLRLER